MHSFLIMHVQVFEYLSTDLKKWMDKSGKGPTYPLPTQTVKVGW